MLLTMQKAFSTLYGASLISESVAMPTGGPTSKNTLPDTNGQLCGPCMHNGFCPIHAGSGRAGAPSISVVDASGAVAQPSPVDKLATIFGEFFNKLVTHISTEVTERVTAQLRAELDERQATAAQPLSEMFDGLWPAPLPSTTAFRMREIDARHAASLKPPTIDPAYAKAFGKLTGALVTAFDSRYGGEARCPVRVVSGNEVAYDDNDYGYLVPTIRAHIEGVVDPSDADSRYFEDIVIDMNPNSIERPFIVHGDPVIASAAPRTHDEVVAMLQLLVGV